MTLEGTEFEDIMRNVKEPLAQLADVQKQLAEVTVRSEYETKLARLEAVNESQTIEIERLKHQLAEKEETIKQQNMRIDAMLVQNTAIALRGLWRMGRFMMSTEKMREQFERCIMANDGHTAYIMLNFAENASYYDLDDENRRMIEGMMNRIGTGITFNGETHIGTYVKNDGTNINHLDQLTNDGRI